MASIDLDDPAMLLFANTHGRKATKVLADALLERETYNASGGYATKVMWAESEREEKSSISMYWG